MRPERTALVLAGTAEARRLLARGAHLRVTASLAGATAAPRLPVPIRIGGWGGDGAFAADLPTWSAVLDATHPFAARVTARTARACAAAGVPYLRLTRPPWPVEPGWTEHPDLAAAAAALPRGARVLLAVGPGGLAPFLGRGLTLWCRRVDPAPPVAGVTWIVGLPGDEAAETGSMRRLGVTHLVTKNAGGARGKLDAARGLGVAVHVIARPPPAPGPQTEDLDVALRFLEAHADHRI